MSTFVHHFRCKSASILPSYHRSNEWFMVFRIFIAGIVGHSNAHRSGPGIDLQKNGILARNDAIQQPSVSHIYLLFVSALCVVVCVCVFFASLEISCCFEPYLSCWYTLMRLHYLICTEHKKSHALICECICICVWFFVVVVAVVSFARSHFCLIFLEFTIKLDNWKIISTNHSKRTKVKILKVD